MSKLSFGLFRTLLICATGLMACERYSVADKAMLVSATFGFWKLAEIHHPDGKIVKAADIAYEQILYRKYTGVIRPDVEIDSIILFKDKQRSFAEGIKKEVSVDMKHKLFVYQLHNSSFFSIELRYNNDRNDPEFGGSLEVSEFVTSEKDIGNAVKYIYKHYPDDDLSSQF